MTWNWTEPGEPVGKKVKPPAASSGIIVHRGGRAYRYHPGYSKYGEVLVPPSYWPADHGDGPGVFRHNPLDDERMAG